MFQSGVPANSIELQCSRTAMLLHTTNSYRELELFVEDGVQSVSEHFGLTRSGLVGQNVDLDVRVRASSQVHGLQAVGLFDSHCEL